MYEKKSELPGFGATGLLHNYLQEVNFEVGSN
jgi:hypothetical protein